MQILYNILARLVNTLLPVSAHFSNKMKLFVEGRKQTYLVLADKIDREDAVIWFHMASLGEFEQGVPIIEVVKELYPKHKIVVSFFSPSGYEVKKNTPLADAVVYLPLDTKKNAKRFLDAVHPELVIFIKYEFWPIYLKELKKRKIHSLLISASFRKDQLFFKFYGGWMINSLSAFDHFFVQNKASEELLHSIGFDNVSVSGDTRFDRVARQIEQDNRLGFVEQFKNGKLCIVAGSTWPEDDALLEDFINSSSNEVKFIIAPHEIKKDKVKDLRHRINKKTVLFSEKENENLRNFQVLIVDTVGLLNQIYSYADIAYVGGAAGNSGLHNILEPATFGVPLIIGKNFKNFPEAEQLRQIAGLYSVADKEELAQIFLKMINNTDFRRKTGMIAGHFISSNTGATEIIKRHLENKNVKIS